MCVKSELFVLLVFTEGAKWGEELFKYLFDTDNSKTNIYEYLTLDNEFYSFNVKTEDQEFINGILIYREKKEREKDKDIFKKPLNDIHLPVVLKIFQTEISLQELEKLGESSEIILSEGSTFPVEILVNGKAVGSGEITVGKDEYTLKIKEINI